jgi:hypothetical protein
MTRSEICTLVWELLYKKVTGKLQPYEVSMVNNRVMIWRQKNNSVIILPLDGSYKRTINPSWYE